MRALRSYGADDIRVDDVPEPAPSDDDDKVIIDVDWCGICGSDLHLWHMGPEKMLSLPPDYTSTRPLILGHELTGRLAAPIPPSIASRRPDLHPGARVVVDPRLYCAACGPCTSPAEEPQSQGCARGLGFMGFTTKAGGGFAERVAASVGAVFVVPEGAEDAGAVAALVEPLAVAWHAVKRAGVEVPGWVGGGGGTRKAGETAVLVVGGGPVGVAVCWVLRAWGVGKVVVSEPLRERREGCKAVADEVVDPGEESVVERCKEVTGGRGVDVVFECAGSPRVVGDCFGSLAFRGTVVVVALWKGDIPVPFPPLMYKETTVTASCAYNETDFGEVVKAFAEGRFKGAESMITARISLEDVVEKGFEALARPDNSHVKILVTPKKSYLA